MAKKVVKSTNVKNAKASKVANVKSVKGASSGIPVWVKVISILYYIGAVFGLLVGIGMIVGSGTFASYFEQVAGIGEVSGSAFVAIGIVMIVLGVLSFFVGRGLWKGQNWARIIAIIFAVLGVLSALNNIIAGVIGNGLFNLVINGLIGWYLWFSKQGKVAFG